MSTLSDGLANKVDDLIRVFDKTPVMGLRERERLGKRFMEAVYARMLDEGLSYEEASGGPEFLDQDDESFRSFMKRADQDLDWQCDTVAAGFERFQRTG